MYPRGLCKRLLIYLTFSILIACLAKDSKDLPHNTKLISDDLDLFQDGDLIFRSGKGIFISRQVLMSKFSNPAIRLFISSKACLS